MPKQKAVKAMCNEVMLYGDITQEPVYSHESTSGAIYGAKIRVKRRSGVADEIPLLLDAALIPQITGRVGIKGCLRGYSRFIEGKKRLFIAVYVDGVLPGDVADQNNVSLNATLMHAPVYRQTPMGREICDLLLCIRRPNGRGCDIVPAIVWGGCARFCRTLEKGAPLHAEGRLQSRQYMKRTQEDVIEERTTYELSISQLQLQE